MRWSVISLDGGRSPGDVVDGRAGASRGPDGEPTVKEPSDAKTALDLIVIPPEVLRIAEMASPRSSLIISDEELSPETGKGTDFVVLLSGLFRLAQVKKTSLRSSEKRGRGGLGAISERLG